MVHTCPKCDRQSLVNDTHGTSRCPRCGGIWVPHSRAAEMLAADDLPVTDGPRSNASDEKGGQCPADRAIMSRTRVELGGGRNALHLERCGSCHGIWFDAGEWKALADSHLLDHLDDFWTAEWRTRQRREHEHDAYDARMKQLFGEELYGQLVATGHALRGHPRRSQALAIIREQSE